MILTTHIVQYVLQVSLFFCLYPTELCMTRDGLAIWPLVEGGRDTLLFLLCGSHFFFLL